MDQCSYMQIIQIYVATWCVYVYPLTITETNFVIFCTFNPLLHSVIYKGHLTKISILKLDVDPQRDDDASPMSTYRCMSRPT